MKRVTELWFTAFGLTCAAIGLAHMLFGSITIIGGGPVNPTIDSDLRFYALLFTAYGLAFVWCARNISARAGTANILGAIFFAGGVARLLAWAVAGAPNWFYIVMVPVELVVPLVNYFLIRKVHAGG
jgi:hypothetical protein